MRQRKLSFFGVVNGVNNTTSINTYIFKRIGNQCKTMKNFSSENKTKKVNRRRPQTTISLNPETIQKINWMKSFYKNLGGFCVSRFVEDDFLDFYDYTVKEQAMIKHNWNQDNPKYAVPLSLSEKKLADLADAKEDVFDKDGNCYSPKVAELNKPEAVNPTKEELQPTQHNVTTE